VISTRMKVFVANGNYKILKQKLEFLKPCVIQCLKTFLKIRDDANK
jgi:hypothetical protein